MRDADQFKHAFVQGASRGIGLGMTRWLLEHDAERVFASSREPWASPGLQQLGDRYPGRLELVELDVTDEHSIRAAARAVGDRVDRLHLMVNAAGVLHGGEMQPEKSLSDLDPAALRRAFEVNAFGPILMAKHFVPFLRHPERAVWANMSARVGSIGDNRLGGWYTYRASKAAQNMFTRTMAIEMSRVAPSAIVFAIHPGTVDTDLSAPFQRNVPEDRLFSVELAADQLMDVIRRAGPEAHGSFLAWDGSPIQW